MVDPPPPLPQKPEAHKWYGRELTGLDVVGPSPGCPDGFCMSQGKPLALQEVPSYAEKDHERLSLQDRTGRGQVLVCAMRWRWIARDPRAVPSLELVQEGGGGI